MRPERPPSGERRGAVRRPAKGALRAQLLLELDSSVLTLSAKGMMVRLAFAPPMGSVHRFVLLFGPRVLEVKGAVRNVRTDPHAGATLYDVGVEFVDLSAEDGGFLEEFVARRT